MDTRKKLELPWMEYGDPSDEQRCILDAKNCIIAVADYMGGINNEFHRREIIKSVNNFPKMLEALEKVVNAYRAAALSEDDMVAFAMSHVDIIAVIQAYSEATRDTQTSQS